MAGLAGRKVLLTGASSGIGRALAIELGRRGARLAIVARRGDRLRSTAETIRAAGGPDPVVLVADLGERGAAAKVGADALAALGGLDVLVNNAGSGVGGTQQMVADRDEGRDSFEVNFWSPLALTASVLHALRAEGAGVVVNVTSMAQVMAWPMMGHYAASKAALAQATETLRLELRGTGVKVVEMILGPVDTPMQGESLLVPGLRRALASSPMGDPSVLARRMAAVIERPRARVVYPSSLRLAYLLPSVTRRYIARLAKKARDEVDVDDKRVLRAGSFGAPEARAAREDWERAHGVDETTSLRGGRNRPWRQALDDLAMATAPLGDESTGVKPGTVTSKRRDQ